MSGRGLNRGQTFGNPFGECRNGNQRVHTQRHGNHGAIHYVKPVVHTPLPVEDTVIVVHDTRTGHDVRFAVTSSKSYALALTTDRSVLTAMYGAGPVAGTGPQPSADGLAHLTLVSCAGTFDHAIGTHDHRLVVFATRIA